jgi:hypothetical protein
MSRTLSDKEYRHSWPALIWIQVTLAGDLNMIGKLPLPVSGGIPPETATACCVGCAWIFPAARVFPVFDI